MTDLLKASLLYLISEQCFDKYFYEYNFLDGACFKAVLSKALGLGIIAGSILVKVPQIIKIWTNKSAEGISLFSVLLDLLAITCHMAYNFANGFPFSSWGDTSFLAIQTAIIATFIYWYGGQTAKAVLFVFSYLTLCYVLMILTPLKYLWTMQAFNIPVLIVGKSSQAYINYQNGSTGQLSAATCFMLLAGSLARIFTSIQETGDSIVILTYAASSTLNGVIVAQLLYYWNKLGNDHKKTQGVKVKAKSKKVD